MKTSKATLILLLSVFTLTSCNKDDDSPTPAPAPNIAFSPSPINLGDVNAQFAKDIPYDVFPETKLDIFLPASSSPTGLVIYVHGGGFVGGDKTEFYEDSRERNFPEEIRTFLSNGVAVASMNYRLLNPQDEEQGVLKCMNDVVRGLQYIRSRASDFNIDKTEVVLNGTSAGAGTSFWIAVNDDMADPESSDPVERESTRVKGFAMWQTQASYNLEKWVDDVFVDYGTTFQDLLELDENPTIPQFYGLQSMSLYDTPQTDAYRAKVDMLALLSPDDPELWAANLLTPVEPPTTQPIAHHHAFHVRTIKHWADSIGVANVCYYGNNPVLYEDPSGETSVQYALRKLGE